MATTPDNPCRDGHPELALLLDITPLGQRYPTMHCRRCGENLAYEEAIRNDERLKLARRFEENGGGDPWAWIYFADVVKVIRTFRGTE